MQEMAGKVIVITGAGSGLGRETALACAKAGARLVLCGRTYSKLERVEQLIAARYGTKVLPVRADVSAEADVKLLVQAALARFGRIDVLINNAAVFQQYELADSPVDSWEYQMSNNAGSVFLMMREVIPVMRRQKGGIIVNMTSGLAREGAGGFGAYAASKAAVEALSYSAADEVHKYGIAVHVLNPGVMKTNLANIGDHPANVAPHVLALLQSGRPSEKRVLQADEVHT